jgi:hypothetical protein
LAKPAAYLSDVSGARRALVLVTVAVFAASCGASDKKSASHQLPRTDQSASPAKIGDAVTLDRSSETTVGGAGESVRTVDGIRLAMHAPATFPAGERTRVALAVTNTTGRRIGYLNTHETHFSLIDQTNTTLWTDHACRPAQSTSVPPSYTVVNAGDTVSFAEDYNENGCRAPAGHAYLTGGLTVCLNLATDGTCRGASAQRIQAAPIAVTVS